MGRLKIKIAKNLLRNDVKLKVVAGSLEMEENKLKSIIYPDINHNPIW